MATPRPTLPTEILPPTREDLKRTHTLPKIWSPPMVTPEQMVRASLMQKRTLRQQRIKEFKAKRTPL